MAPCPEDIQNENASYPPVNTHTAERAHRNDSKLEDWSSFLREWEAEVSKQYDEEEAAEAEDSDFESFLDQDPDKCGWSHSAYFKNEKRFM